MAVDGLTDDEWDLLSFGEKTILKVIDRGFKQLTKALISQKQEIKGDMTHMAFETQALATVVQQVVTDEGAADTLLDNLKQKFDAAEAAVAGNATAEAAVRDAIAALNDVHTQLSQHVTQDTPAPAAEPEPTPAPTPGPEENPPAPAPVEGEPPVPAPAPQAAEPQPPADEGSGEAPAA